MISSSTGLTHEQLMQPLGPAFRVYFETTARLLDRLEKRLKDQLGLTLSEYNMLLLLSEAPEGRMRMGQLASAIVFSPSRLTYQVKVLSERGLVRRVKCSEDGRSWQAELTDEGRAVFRRARLFMQEASSVCLLMLSQRSTTDNHQFLVRLPTTLTRRLKTKPTGSA